MGRGRASSERAVADNGERGVLQIGRVISERQVQVGLRQTLVTQARRLEWLASERFAEAGGQAAVEVKTAEDDVK